MCDRRAACPERDAAKRHVGTWELHVDPTTAQNVQYIMDEAAREGVDLGDVGQVITFCIYTVANFIAARASFDLGDGGEQ